MDLRELYHGLIKTKEIPKGMTECNLMDFNEFRMAVDVLGKHAPAEKSELNTLLARSVDKVQNLIDLVQNENVCPEYSDFLEEIEDLLIKAIGKAG